MPLIVENGKVFVVDKDHPDARPNLEWDLPVECPYCEYRAEDDAEMSSHVITEHDDEVPPVDMGSADDEGVYSVTSLGDDSE